MKKLDKLAKLSKEHRLSVYMSFLEGDIGGVEIFEGGDKLRRVSQEDGETIGDMFGRAIDVIETEFCEEPEDEVVIKVSIRLDHHTGERWTVHQFHSSPTNFAHISENLHQAVNDAHNNYNGRSRSYGEWFDIITVIVRMPDGMWVDLRMARDERNTGLWSTQEDYRATGKSARFIHQMESVPTPHLITGFIKNAFKIAEQLAKRDNPAIS